MPHKRAIPPSKLPLSQSSKRNVESCPNSFVIHNDNKEIESLRHKRSGKPENASILESFQENKPISAAVANLSKAHTTSNTPDFFLQMKENQQVSPAGVKNFCPPNTNDSPFQHYALMTYSSGQMMSSLYPKYNVSLPFFSHYSNYSLHNPGGINGSGSSFNKVDGLKQSCFQGGQSFPTFFNPRTASNMPHREKVNSWIENIPVYEIEEGLWESECYDMEYSMEWEEDEFESPDVYGTSTISYATNDEILFLQARKFETLVRKSYESENEIRLSEKDFSLDSNSITDYI